MYTSSEYLIGSVVLNADYKPKYGKKELLWGTISSLMKIDFLVGAFQTFRVDFFLFLPFSLQKSFLVSSL